MPLAKNHGPGEWRANRKYFEIAGNYLSKRFLTPMVNVSRGIASLPNVFTAHQVQTTPERLPGNTDKEVGRGQSVQDLERRIRVRQVLEHLAADHQMRRVLFRLEVIDTCDLPIDLTILDLLLGSGNIDYLGREIAGLDRDFIPAKDSGQVALPAADLVYTFRLN